MRTRACGYGMACSGLLLEPVPVRQCVHDRRINLTFRHIVENR